MLTNKDINDNMYLDTRKCFLFEIKEKCFLKKLFGFFKNTFKEMKNVRWPNKKEMALYSAATFTCIILFALYFTLIDALIALAKMVLI